MRRQPHYGPFRMVRTVPFKDQWKIVDTRTDEIPLIVGARAEGLTRVQAGGLISKLLSPVQKK